MGTTLGTGVAPMIAVVTGGRDHWPSLAELERGVEIFRERGVTGFRDGDCVTGVDRVFRRWILARCGRDFLPDPHSAASFGEWPECGPIRNRAMLDGDGQGALFGESTRPPAGLLLAFKPGPRGTLDCIDAAGNRGIETIRIKPVIEPRPWNRHHGTPPGPSVYVGRGHILGNPFAMPDHVTPKTRATEAVRMLATYRDWLWTRLNPASEHHNPRFGQALNDLDPRGFVVCSCWPLHCHAEVIVRAWRHRQRTKVE